MFNIYAAVLVTVTSMNTFFVVFHRYDSEDSEATPRYKLGYFFYMLNFFIQTLLLLSTFVYAFILYFKLAFFLKPKSRRYDENGDEILSDDDEFINQGKDPFETKRDVLRKVFEPRYVKFNLNFIYILVALTVRVGTYIGLRLVSKKKMFEWIYIKPEVYYVTFATDILVLLWVLNFIYKSAPLKVQYQTVHGNIP